MYKTELQELCHKRRWGLPKYSAMKDGPDHMPSFKASVYVNGVTFTSSGVSSSLKEAHNQAAMLAFLSFSSGTPPLSLSGFFLFAWKFLSLLFFLAGDDDLEIGNSDSSTPTATHDAKEKIGAVKPQDIPIPAQSSVIIDDKDRFCKNQTQNNLEPPVLTCKTEDLPPASHFKAAVLVNGQSFESPTFFNTKKEAEQAAAKLDLMSLSLDNFEKASILGDSGSFKTSLLELTEREGFCKPTYKTMKAGSPDMPTFFSTVEVEGVEFHGKGDELLDLDLNQTLLANVKVSNEMHNPSFRQPSEEEMMNNGNSPSSPKSPPLSQIDVSSLSISQSSDSKAKNSRNI
ncbi:Double-stranded RNA-binding protein 3, partial [Mucuna pruriens]